MVLFVLIFDNRIQDSVIRGTGSDSILGCFDSIKSFAEFFCHKCSKSAPMMLFETGDERGCLLSFAGDPTHVLEERLKGISPCPLESGGITFPLTNAFTIVNKYRIKNATDHFGHGRIPWYSMIF